MSSVAVAAVKPPRKFPPPCWTRDEALVLIEAYRERWYALHRAFLRTPDWDSVADKVTSACPDVSPPKTSAQCRHKMEKLRQRHRAEKLRASSFPGGRFFSSWFYFEAMEAMENGPNYDPEAQDNPIQIQTQTQIHVPIQQVLPDHQVLNPGRGIRFKPSSVQNLVTLAASSTNHYSSLCWSNQEDDDGNEDGYFVDPKPSIRTDVRARKFAKVVREHEFDENGEMWVKVGRDCRTENGSDPDPGSGKKRCGVEEVVESIKVLGDGFMKIEKMKIEMAREIERMRMESEMKRNQLILESQRQIVEVFVKGLIEMKKTTATTTVKTEL